MTYFDCFVVGAWTFVIGWFIGALYVQNQQEEEGAEIVEKPELVPDRDELRFPNAAGAVVAE